MQKHHTLYLAYGSNLNVSQMSSRCPDAIPMGGFYLPDYKLVFRGVADIEYEKGNAIPVGMWHSAYKLIPCHSTSLRPALFDSDRSFDPLTASRTLTRCRHMAYEGDFFEAEF